MKMKDFIKGVNNSKLRIKCAGCDRDWVVGDRERTDQEREIWLCPNCVDKERNMEATIDQMNEEREDEEEIMSPKDVPNFYQE